MIYFSTSKSSTPVSIKRATLEGLAPDGGLYVPSQIPTFSPGELSLLEGARFSDIALAIAKNSSGGNLPHCAAGSGYCLLRFSHSHRVS